MALRSAGKPEIFYHKSVESGNETGKARFFALTVVSSHIQATSISGAVAHNIGQVIAAMFVVRTPMLLGTYLPVLIGVGMLVGSLTGIVTDRVLKSMHLTAE